MSARCRLYTLLSLLLSSHTLLPLLLTSLTLTLVCSQECTEEGVTPIKVKYEFYPRRIQKDLHLNCKDTVKPKCTIKKVEWTLHNKPISSSDSRYKISTPEDAKLTIVNPNKRYIGLYKATITARGAANIEDHTVTCEVKVTGDPLVLFNLDYASDELTRHFREGETVDIGRQFEILGYPIHKIEWYRDGIKLQPNTRILMTKDDRDHKTKRKLKIRRVTKEDAGEYEVRVTGGDNNLTDTKSRTFRIVNDIDFFMPLILIAAEIGIFIILFVINHCLHKRKMRKREEKRLKRIVSQSNMEVASETETKTKSVTPQSEMRQESLAYSEHTTAQSIKSAETYSAMSARQSMVKNTDS